MDDFDAPTPELLVRCRSHRADWKQFRGFLHRLAAELAHAPFTVAIVSDKAIRELNHSFRKKDYSTDVLSFPAGNRRTRGGPEPGLGDIVISAPTAMRAARDNGWTLEAELRALALHGVLHLLGYDHETDRGQMARAERVWGRRLQLPQTLIALHYPKRRK